MRTAIFILPDAQTPGMLEDLCLRAVADDPVMPCVQEFFDCIQRRCDTSPGTMPKAKTHAFLASRERPGLRLGEAAMKGYWPWADPAFDEVRRFLRALGERHADENSDA